MSGMHMAFMANSPGAVIGFSASLGDSEAFPTVASCSFSINTDGSIGVTGNSSSATAGWFSPIGGTPGNGYWVKATVAGDTPTTGTVGSVLALSSNRTWVWNVSGATKSATLTIALYSDAGGTVLVSSTDISVSLDSL